MNERERPRVLLWVTSDDELPLFDWVEERSGTFKRIRNLNEVDLDEWDVLVTNESHTWISSGQYGHLIANAWDRVPENLYVFRVFGSTVGGSGKRYFEFNLDGDGDADTRSALYLESGVAGHKMLRVAGLPEPIQDLVKSELMPVLEKRSKQWGILKSGELAPAVIKWRPFLYGPSELIMAASYERPGGRSIWLIPRDAPNHAAWFDMAITEWHISDPKTFPTISTWQTDPQWDTIEELGARDALQAIITEFNAAAAEFEAKRDSAKEQLERASALARSGAKSLLTAQDDPLQDSVLNALAALGFQVEDMDKAWPDRERREDFRIRDADDPDWIAIADATGVAKGAPGSKITTVVGYVTKYILETKAESAPCVWIIVNRLFHRDPMTRGDVYRGDDLAVLVSHDGLAIDSAALYLLIQSIAPASDRAKACRAWLRAARGQVTASDAIGWLEANSG